MKILVTGGFGFLGSHLLELLLSDADSHVHVVDNLSTSPLPLEDLLEELGHPSRLSYTIAELSRFCAGGGDGQYDEIYHLASIVGPAGVLPHAGRIAASIVNDTSAICDVAMRCGAVLVDVSTSEVYGGGQEGFCSESMPKIVPATSSARLEYAVGKLAAETIVGNLCRTGGLRARIVRPFNVSGPRQSGKGGFVLPRFIAQAMAGIDLTVFGDGSQVRAFTHVTDLVAGIRLAARRGADGEAYNLGNPDNRCSIRELAEDVLRVTRSTARIVCIDPREVYGPHYEEATNKFPDAAKAMAKLRWTPRHDRARTIRDTFEYMRRVPAPLRARLSGFDVRACA